MSAEKKQTDQPPKEWLDDPESIVLHAITEDNIEKRKYVQIRRDDFDRLVRMARKGLDHETLLKRLRDNGDASIGTGVWNTINQALEDRE